MIINENFGNLSVQTGKYNYLCELENISKFCESNLFKVNIMHNLKYFKSSDKILLR